MVLAANLCRFLQESFRRNYDTGLALNGLDQEGTRIWRDGRSQCRCVTEGNDLEARSERSKPIAVLFVGGKAANRDGASVKVIGANDDLSLTRRNPFNFVSPLTRRLDRSFHGFGPGIHGQGHVE